MNARTELVPRWGEWHAADINPPVLLQLRAWFSGKFAVTEHPVGDWYDFLWGRGGMHTNWGLGLPVLGIPFHLVARLLGIPGFPDHLRFLVLYAIAMAVFTRALHRVSRGEPGALVASAGVSAFVLAFPTFVGLIAARFLVYEQTIAVGALWVIVLLAGVLALLERSTTRRLLLVCIAAAMTISFRPPLAAYGLTTIVLAVLIARRRGLAPRGLLAAVAAAAFVVGLYLATNFERFGSPFELGYANIVSQPAVNRLNRWGLEHQKTPLPTAAREMFATLFLLEPVAAPMSLPASVAPYAVGERWREYYSPGYDLWVFAAWIAAMAVVAGRIVRQRLWRHDRDLRDQVATVIGVWALPPSLALFLFYAKAANLVTRYLVDFFPAYAAAVVCVAMAAVDLARKRAPKRVAAVQVAIAAMALAYLSGGDGWPHALSRPVTGDALEGRLAQIDAQSAQQPIPPGHLESTDPRGHDPVFGHLAVWRQDGLFESGMLFAFPRSACIAFTLREVGDGGWGPNEDASLAGFRVRADFDELRSCGAPQDDGAARRVTFCEPRPPRFVLDGMRLYSVASLDENLRPSYRLRITRIDTAPGCP